MRAANQGWTQDPGGALERAEKLAQKAIALDDLSSNAHALLGDVAEALGQDPQTDLELPPYEVGEDFVEGTLRFGSTSLRVYYEYSLSYLALMSDSEGTLQDVADRVQRSAK